MATGFEVKGAIVEGRLRLRWKPVKRAFEYGVRWLGRDRQWYTIDLVARTEVTPDKDGLISWVDEVDPPGGPGGTYRIVAMLGKSVDCPTIESAVMTVRRRPSTKRGTPSLSDRIKRAKVSRAAKPYLLALKRTQGRWKLLLPKEAGVCFDQRIEFEVGRADPTDADLEMIGTVIDALPKLTARAEKAFEDYGGYAALDEEDKLSRPRIVVGDVSKPAGGWTMIVEIKGSDFGWHIEFVNTRFKEIWAGD